MEASSRRRRPGPPSRRQCAEAFFADAWNGVAARLAAGLRLKNDLPAAVLR
ncbi:hypothetical protein [Nonomuraea sp. NPDC049309]|uniref:hypothetical protein n=1 Tax=Nonomuraea sp. NPDC049309 TaxID=3364350 RepID=UPI00372097AF